MQQEKFRFSRVPVNIEAEYELKSLKDKCTIIDISQGGMRIEVRQVLVPGDMIKIKFHIFLPKAGREEIEAWCVVRSFSGDEAGLEFDEIPYAKKDLLMEYINHLLILYGKEKREPY